MAGSSFGTIFRVTTWGESHGKGIGVVIDGCPAGLALSEKDINEYLDRRKPGQSLYSTSRSEDDQAEILSGVFEGKTTGTPISLMVRSTDIHSEDYDEIASCYRPGHADFTYDAKYGFRDPRGGGRSSGRETVGRVAAGAVAAKILKDMGVTFLTYARSIGPVCIDETAFDAEQISKNPLCMPDGTAAEKAGEYIRSCMERRDSCGGVIECVITGLPAGIGEPVFGKLDASLAEAVISIGAVKGFETGSGFDSAKMTGTEHNDSFVPDGSGGITKATNHAGGILGGISDGSPVVFRAAVKPTPSVGAPQETVTKDGNPAEINISGRHDPTIVPRAVVVVEAMAALTVLDLMMINMSSRMEYIEKIYKR